MTILGSPVRIVDDAGSNPLGAASDPAWGGVGDASAIALLKTLVAAATDTSTVAVSIEGTGAATNIGAILTNSGNAATALGAPADAAVSDPTVSASVIAAIKGQNKAIGSSSGGTAGTVSWQMGGVYKAALPTLTDGQQSAIMVDANGRVQTTPNLLISTATPTQLTAGTRQPALGTSMGAMVVQPYAIPNLMWSVQTSASLTTAAETTAKAAGGASLGLFVTSMQVSNNSATATFIALLSGTGGTVIGRWYLPANSVRDFVFPTPLKTASNTLLSFKVETAGAAVDYAIQGFTAYAT